VIAAVFKFTRELVCPECSRLPEKHRHKALERVLVFSCVEEWRNVLLNSAAPHLHVGCSRYCSLLPVRLRGPLPRAVSRYDITVVDFAGVI